MWSKAQIALGLGVIAALAVAIVALVTYSRPVKKVVVTKTVAKTQTFNGTLSSLVGFLHPRTASQVKCPKGTPSGAACFDFGSVKWFVFFAAPADAAAA